MPDLLGALRANSAYAFVAVGAVWLGVAVIAGSLLILWPVVACILSGLMLKLRPGRRLTWAWVLSSATLGFLVAAYQVYSWAPFLGGAFSTLAGGASAGFAALAAVHLFLLYAGASSPKEVRQDQS